MGNHTGEEPSKYARGVTGSRRKKIVKDNPENISPNRGEGDNARTLLLTEPGPSTAVENPINGERGRPHKGRGTAKRVGNAPVGKGESKKGADRLQGGESTGR